MNYVKNSSKRVLFQWHKFHDCFFFFFSSFLFLTIIFFSLFIFFFFLTLQYSLYIFSYIIYPVINILIYFKIDTLSISILSYYSSFSLYNILSYAHTHTLSCSLSSYIYSSPSQNVFICKFVILFSTSPNLLQSIQIIFHQSSRTTAIRYRPPSCDLPNTILIPSNVSVALNQHFATFDTLEELPGIDFLEKITDTLQKRTSIVVSLCRCNPPCQ